MNEKTMKGLDQRTEMGRIVMLTNAPYGGMVLTAPQWAGQVVGVLWEDAPGAGTVHARHATRTTGWDAPGCQVEGLDLRSPESNGVILSVDCPAGLYMVTGVDALVPVRLATRGVIMRVRVDADGMIGLPPGPWDQPLELTGGWARGAVGSACHWLLGAATAACRSGVPYDVDGYWGVDQGDYAVVSRCDGLSPIWLGVAR